MLKNRKLLLIPILAQILLPSYTTATSVQNIEICTTNCVSQTIEYATSDIIQAEQNLILNTVSLNNIYVLLFSVFLIFGLLSLRKYSVKFISTYSKLLTFISFQKRLLSLESFIKSTRYNQFYKKISSPPVC